MSIHVCQFDCMDLESPTKLVTIGFVEEKHITVPAHHKPGSRISYLSGERTNGIPHPVIRFNPLSCQKLFTSNTLCYHIEKFFISTMSATTSSQTTTVDQATIRNARIQAILGDYAIYTTGTSSSLDGGVTAGTIPSAGQTPTSQSEAEDGAIDPTTEPHPRVEGVISPSWWPRNWRSIPEYAPINRHLGMDARPSGANAAEKTMIMIVLNGCALLSVSWVSNKLFTVYEECNFGRDL
jgi:hypothetical protein